MSNIPLRVLIVEDSSDDTTLLIRILRKGGFEPTFERVATEDTMRSALHEKPWDLILSDYKMPNFDGLHALAVLKESGLDIPFIIVSGTIGEEIAVEALKAGANDYVMKGNLPRLIPAIERELKEACGRQERRKGESDLRQSQERLELALNGADLGMWDLDVRTGRGIINERSAEIVGYTLDEVELTLDFFLSLIHPDDKFRVVEVLRGRLQGLEDSFETEYRLHAKSGECIWVLSRGKVVKRDEHGRPLRMAGTFMDITDRKQMEEELKKSEERYRTLFDNMREGFAYCKMLFDDYGSPYDWVYLNVNSAFARLTGLENVIGKRVTEVIPGIKEAHPELFEIYGRVALTGQPEKLEIYFDPLGIFLKISVLSTAKEHFVTVFEDITDHRKAEQSLRESEKTSRLLIEQSPIGIAVFQEERVVYVNPALLDMHGYQNPDEVLGRSMEGFVSPGDLVLIKKSNKNRLLGKPAPTHCEVRAVKKNAESFDLTLWPRLIEYDGKPAILTFCVDRTEAKALRNQLLQAQKMEAVGTLAGGVAHDFNNILQIVLGYSESLLIAKNPEHPDFSNLRKINTTAKRGADLVQRLMTFSRKGDSKPRPLNLNHEVTQVKKLLERTIPKMISIELRLEDKLAVINADSIQVEQILMNLAINARDAIPQQGGTLTVETKNVTLDDEYCGLHVGSKPGPHVMLSVSDTGHGMSQDIVEHIFEPFYTTKDAGKGTGLGLAMVYGIVKQHEGYISCHSVPDQGTTFCIYFPVAPIELEQNSEQDSSSFLGGFETILLVDDEEFVCDMGSQLLTQAGYTVLTATGGKEAIELYKEQRSDISLVILDKVMPEMGGIQCFQELVKINPHARVIISSGVISDGTQRDAKELGAKGFVEKPYNMRQLLQTIRQVLDED